MCLTILLIWIVHSLSKGQTTDFQSWNSFLTFWNFYPSLVFEMELDYYTLVSDGPAWREIAVQPSLEYYPNNSIDLFTGVYLSSTKQNDVDNTWETRPFAGIRWNIIKPEKRVFLRVAAKLEYRFFSQDDGSTNAGRLRTKADLFVPINQKTMDVDKNLYGILQAEKFFNFENDIRERYQSSFRQNVGAGYRFTFNWRLEMLYIFQTSRDSSEDDQPDRQNHIIQLTGKYFIGK